MVLPPWPLVGDSLIICSSLDCAVILVCHVTTDRGCHMLPASIVCTGLSGCPLTCLLVPRYFVQYTLVWWSRWLALSDLCPMGWRFEPSPVHPPLSEHPLSGWEDANSTFYWRYVLLLPPITGSLYRTKQSDSFFVFCILLISIEKAI